jgi:hypothetical protein
METFEFEKDGIKKEVPYTASIDLTVSMGDRSKMRKFLESWRGRAFSDDELLKFDTSNILGKTCTINVLLKEGNKFPKIENIAQVIKGVTVPDPTNKVYEFSIDTGTQEEFDTLRNFDKMTILKSPEGQKFMTIDPSMVGTTDDDTPY